MPLISISAHEKIMETTNSTRRTTTLFHLLAMTLVLVGGKAAQAQDLYLTSGQYFATDDTYGARAINVGMDSGGSRTDNGGNTYVASLNIVDGGKVGTVNGYNTSTVGMSGGSMINTNAYDNSTVTLTGGVVNGVVFGYDTSTTNLSGTAYTYNVFSYGNSVFNMSGGIVEGVYRYNNSTANISDGYTVAAFGFNTGAINVSGGSVDHATVLDTSAINVSGGHVGTITSVFTSGVHITGGTVFNIQGKDSSTVRISNGTVTGAYANNTSFLNISGGTMINTYALNAGTVNISGGNLTDVYGFTDSVYNITGGSIVGDIRVLDGSVFNFTGTDLAFSAAGTGSDTFGSYIAYTLTGILEDGTPLNSVRYLDYLGGQDVQNPIAGTGNLRFITVAAPEPASGLLLFSGMAFAAGYRRRNGR